MTREYLMQYADMKREIGEVMMKAGRLERDIGLLESRLEGMASDGTVVKDKVYGGYGGVQAFVIEGFPSGEYERNRSGLMAKKLLLCERKAALEDLEMELMRRTNEIESFIAGIGDSHIRRIVSLRVIEGLSWRDVADRVGGNTEGSVKMAFKRFLEGG